MKKINIQIITITGILTYFSCCQLPVKKTINNELKLNCSEILTSIETNLLLSCPITKRPDSVISYLAKQPKFIRNKEYEYRNRSVRFNAMNASFGQYDLVDEKSLFLLNYFTNEDGKTTFSLFQAIYFFKSEDDKSQVYKKIIEILDDKLKLIPKVMYTMRNEAYLRYNLPCGSGFNLKQTINWSDRHVIDILWVPDITK